MSIDRATPNGHLRRLPEACLPADVPNAAGDSRFASPRPLSSSAAKPASNADISRVRTNPLTSFEISPASPGVKAPSETASRIAVLAATAWAEHSISGMHHVSTHKRRVASLRGLGPYTKPR